VLDVKTQTNLKAKGYYNGNLDGIFASLSFAALIGYAASRKPDGGIIARGEVANEFYAAAGLTSDEYQISEFLAQMVLESRAFTATREDLNYSAAGILSTWGPGHGGRVANMAEAKKLAGKPQLLANKVYGGRFGNTGPNDGWLYRGAFDIQLTFKANWIKYSPPGIDLTSDPTKYANDPKMSHRIAIEYWKDNKVPDAVHDRDFIGARKIVNLGDRHSKATPHGVTAVKTTRERILAIL
jgi:putative chitinase